MFYLLENNKIIDTNKLLNSGIQINIKKSQKFKVVYLVGWFGERFLGTIKKQSKNVFDLIEVGDLVENFSTISKVFKIINGTILTPLDIPFDVSLVIKIYKPDGKGNYIKVWEREDENETCNGTD